LVVFIYLWWLLFNVLRGGFVAENYWEWKQLIDGSLSLSVPLALFSFHNPQILHRILSIWIKYALPLFFLFFMWVTTNGSKHFYLGPALLLSCFLPVLKRKWQLIFLGLLLLMLVADLGARSQVIKALASLGISAAYFMPRGILKKILRTVHWLFYILPLILLTLGITGRFNVFADLASNEGKYVERKVVDGQIVEEDLSSDTRTFIYVEVIES